MKEAIGKESYMILQNLCNSLLKAAGVMSINQVNKALDSFEIRKNDLKEIQKVSDKLNKKK